MQSDIRHAFTLVVITPQSVKFIRNFNGCLKCNLLIGSGMNYFAFQYCQTYQVSILNTASPFSGFLADELVKNRRGFH